MYSRMNNFDSSQFNVSMSDAHLMHLDPAGTSNQRYTNTSTTEAFADVSNLDPWGPARSLNNTTQGQNMSANNSTLSVFGVNNSQAAPLSGLTQSLSGGPAFMSAAGQSMTMPELPSAMFDDDLTFLEDILLPDFIGNVTGFTTPMYVDFDPTAGQPTPPTSAPDISEPRLFLPSFPSSERPSEARHSAFDISPGDVAQFQKDIAGTGQLNNFPFPRRSRIFRCLSAYFDHVDPHVPIVQHATFSFCGTAPALVLAMLAMGATITSEYQFAESAYEAACKLLDHKMKQNTRASPSFEFWPIQASLLCAQFGAFSDNKTFAQRSQTQLSNVSGMLKLGLNDLAAKRSEPRQDWKSWSFIETFSRAASWSCSLSAILLAYDHTFHISTQHYLQYVPLPSDEDLWRARSAHEWSSVGGAQQQDSHVSFLTFAESLFNGQPILEKVSCFGLFSLVGWMLLYICNHERMKMSVGSLDLFETDFTTKINKGLEAWETLTRRHLRTGQVMFKQLNPLISDSFPLLGSAYYHLHVGDELRALKEIAGEQAMGAGTSGPQTFPAFSSRLPVYKAVRYAANSCLVRAKLGISHFQQSPDVYGAHGAIGAFEAGK